MIWHNTVAQLPPPNVLVVCVWLGADRSDDDYAAAYWNEADWVEADAGESILTPPDAWAEMREYR